MQVRHAAARAVPHRAHAHRGPRQTHPLRPLRGDQSPAIPGPAEAVRLPSARRAGTNVAGEARGPSEHLGGERARGRVHPGRRAAFRRGDGEARGLGECRGRQLGRGCRDGMLRWNRAAMDTGRRADDLARYVNYLILEFTYGQFN